MHTSEVLNTAADLIEERGWTTGAADDSWGREGGAVCLEGGIMAAAGIPHIFEVPECPAYRAVWDYLQKDDRWGGFESRLYDWNDANGRTAAEVIEVLRAAAVIEAAKEVDEARHARKVAAVRALHGPAAADRLAGA